MSVLFEITGNDIAQLDDADLRTLIGLLCEADYRLDGLSTVGITWGGHQDAPDGGLDVVVRSTDAPPKASFIPRSITGFQVKKPDMQPAEIRKEMKPRDTLRAEIKGLIQENGAYIIISSTGSTSDKALKSRVKAMQEAVEQEENHEAIYLDFFDKGRIASWVRNHPSLVLWVRNQIGRQLKGWHPYENWAKAPNGIEEEYLIDEGLRLHDGTKTEESELTINAGLVRVRSILSTPGTSVRLTGLSGVGKTRLVQAFFDERLGEKALNRSQAFYTDISDSPDPDPKTFAEQLIANKTRAILIVDNCPPDLHSRLTQTCSTANSTVSLLTVEYDVRDDLPEETSVFRLEPASEDIITKLIRKRFPHIGQVDAKTIAEFSGGNARIAIALANTVQQGETLSGFRNEQLFERLFKQRNNDNEALLLSATVLSLVYSFEGTDASSDKSELKFLASLIDKSGAELYRDMAELKSRGLIQSRGMWRAILPHAIANRLARRALETIPKDKLVDAFLHSESERLIKSFSRRLNYLHDCPIAVEIANDWLEEGGWLGKEKGNYNDFRMAIFENIAAVSPGKALEAIERFASGEEGAVFASRDNKHFSNYVRLLRHLAYEPEFFERSVAVISRFALTERPEENYDSIRDVLESLFYIYLSGTHASVEARAKVIEDFLNAPETEKQELGLLLLDATLETMHFSSVHEFGFGARPRNYGYSPETRKEVMQWYSTFIDICTRLALSGKPIAAKAKKILSNNLRGLWAQAGMFDAIEQSASALLKQGSWNEGWISVRSILRHDSKGLKKEFVDRLQKLEQLLKPKDLLEQARTYALSDQHHIFDLEDDYDDEEDVSAHFRKVDAKTREIGTQVAQDEKILQELLPGLVSSENIRLHNFGQGLADGTNDKRKLWGVFRTQLEKTSPEKRRLRVLYGFLSACAESEPKTYQAILDEILEDDLLGEYFPLFQTTGTIDERGVERLQRALEIGRAPIGAYCHIGYGRAHESISDDNLATLLEKILSKDGGVYTALQILLMRFHRPKEAEPHSNNLIAAARETLLQYPFSEERRRHNDNDHELAEIAGKCLVGEGGANVATELCHSLAEAIADNRVYSHTYPLLLGRLAELQPSSFMEAFLENESIPNSRRRRIFSNNFDREDNPLNQIPDEAMLEWCTTNPESRYPLIAGAIQPYRTSAETGGLEWKPIVHSIFENAPNLDVVLEQLANGLHPTSWSGSLAALLQERLVLFQSLCDHPDTKISGWAKNQSLVLQEQINRQRKWEQNRTRERDESFE